MSEIKKERIECPACGKKAIVEISALEATIKEFICPKCDVIFTLVFNRDLIMEKIERQFYLALDYE